MPPWPVADRGPFTKGRHLAAGTEEGVTTDARAWRRGSPGDVELVRLAVVTLPELHLADWRATKDTLHLYAQIVGKIRLATTPPRNHWWNVPLYVDVRGLTTRRLHHGGTTFEITFDFVDHALVVRTADGRTRSFELGDGASRRRFDARLHAVARAISASTSRSGSEPSACR